MLHEMTNVVPQRHGSVTTPAPFAHTQHFTKYSLTLDIYIHFENECEKKTTYTKNEPIHIISFVRHFAASG